MFVPTMTSRSRNRWIPSGGVLPFVFYPGILLLCLLSCTAIVASFSFLTRNHPQHQHHRGTRITTTKHTTITPSQFHSVSPSSSTVENECDEEEEEEKDEEEEDESSTTRTTTRTTELWLDLRQTSFLPHTVLEQLAGQLGLGTETGSVVDKVLVSESVYRNLLVQWKSFTTNTTATKLFESSVPILYSSLSSASSSSSSSDDTNNNNDDLYLASEEGTTSRPFGSIITPSTSASSSSSRGGADPSTMLAVEDPMAALDILSNGHWVVLDTPPTQHHDPTTLDRIRTVGNFLDLLSASGCRMSSSSARTKEEQEERNIGLFLPRTQTHTTANQSSKTNTNQHQQDAGVAVVCQTKAEIMELATIVQLLQQTITSLDGSGILLPNSTSDSTSNSSNKSSSNSSTSSSDSDSATTDKLVVPSSSSSEIVPTAVVIPFDLELWQIATCMFG